MGQINCSYLEGDETLDPLNLVLAEFRRRAQESDDLDIETVRYAPKSGGHEGYIQTIVVRLRDRLGGEVLIARIGHKGVVYRAYLNEEARNRGTPRSLRATLPVDFNRGLIVDGESYDSLQDVVDRLVAEAELLGRRAEEEILWD